MAVYTDRLTQTFSDTGFFGHPRGLSTLFFVEMWERFSYYGMRALLILFMTASTATGGLGMGVAEAGAIYGIYTSSVYLLSLPGGWLADTFLGQRRAVLLGGILIASGQFLLAAPMIATFYAGLATVCLGTGLLKPNASTIVGQLYQPGDPRRDSGFSIFYIGINVGAFIAPLVCGYLRVAIGWRIAFAAAGAGMLVGLLQFTLGAKNLGDAGRRPAVAIPSRKDYTKLKLLIALIILVFAAMAFGRVSAELFANVLGVALLLIFFVVFGFMFLAGNWTRTERNRLIVIALLVVAATLFWSSFEQAGSTLNLFAERSTNNLLFGISYTPEVYQSLNSMFMILGMAQFFAWLWIALGPRDPAPPWKFALGLIFVGLGFAVLIPASQIADTGQRVSPWWLVATYFLHTVGELCLSPVGLSAMTKLAPARVAGLMMGVWFLSNAMGNYLGGRLASFYESFPISALFGAVAIFSIGFGVLMALIAKPLTKLMEGAK